MVMGQLDRNNGSLARGLEAALAWWREAGVDCAFVDAPQDWLAAEKPAPEHKYSRKEPIAAAPASARNAPPAPQTIQIAADRKNWPATAEAFPSWWMNEPTLAPRGLIRVPPRGPANPALMVIVPMPAEDDEKVLLSGRTGRLLDAIIAAFGIDSGQVYRASALPSRIALPDWTALAAAGLGALLAHHVGLVAPQRLVVFGRTDISALMGHDSAHSALHLRALNHESGSIPAGFEYDLETIFAKPGLKAGVWQRWLDGGLAETGSSKTGR